MLNLDMKISEFLKYLRGLRESSSYEAFRKNRTSYATLCISINSLVSWMILQ